MKSEVTHLRSRNRIAPGGIDTRGLLVAREHRAKHVAVAVALEWLQDRDELGQQHQRASVSVLGLAQVRNAGIQVHLPPPQGQQFALARSCEHGHERQCV
jgi:hypothetical protein